MQARFTTAVLLGFILVGAAACGGGGGDDEAQLRTDLEAAQQELEDQRKAAEEAEEARKEAEEEAAEAERKRKEAEQEAADAAQAEQDAADAEAARLAAEEAQRQAEQQREAADAARQEAEQAELNARASAYIAAINTGGGTATRSGVTVAHERGSAREINPGGNFQAGSGAPAISGFTAHAFSRRVSSSEQTAYLYTNIQAPGTRPFWQLHGVNEIEAAQADAFDPTPTAAARVATVDGNLEVSVSGTYDGVSGTYTCSDCNITDENGDGSVTAADFNAADWVMLDAGVRSFASGTAWDFKPRSVNSGVRQERDNEHLYFGIWVREPNVASQAHSYEYIVGGLTSVLTNNVPVAGDALANFNALTGTANFTGGAIGKYVTRDQVGENARIGTFSATATFTADFDNGTDPGTLEGRITNFQSAGQTLEGEWYLYLGDVTITDGVVTSEAPAEFAGGTVSGQEAMGEIGGVSVSGTWDATLYGSDNVVLSDDDRDDYPVGSHPVANLAGIAGKFHATTNNDAAIATAAIAGAFGVTPQ